MARKKNNARNIIYAIRQRLESLGLTETDKLVEDAAKRAKRIKMALANKIMQENLTRVMKIVERNFADRNMMIHPEDAKHFAGLLISISISQGPRFTVEDMKGRPHSIDILDDKTIDDFVSAIKIEEVEKKKQTKGVK